MAYVLIATAAIFVVVGLTQLKAKASHATPWGSLLVWAALVGVGASVWMMTTQVH